MINIKKVQRLGLLVLTALSFIICILFAQPSDAINTNYQQMITLGLADRVATPQEIGLDYLAVQPMELTDGGDLINSIRNVARTVAQMPEDLNIAIPLGTNKPVRIGQLTGDSNKPATDDMEAIGFTDSQGQQKNIKPSNVEDMTNTELRNEGNLTPNRFSKAQNILLADASGSFLQAQRIPTITLIARNRKTDEIVLLPNVNANAFCRDVLNAFLNNTYKSI